MIFFYFVRKKQMVAKRYRLVYSGRIVITQMEKTMKKIKTLLVDDDYLVLQDLKKMVDWNALGFSLTEAAANGKKALELARKEKPDLIVSDISMPVMDGFDFVETLKKENPDTYIIFISSYASFDYARRAMQNHIHSYLLKNEMTAGSLTEELLIARKNILQNESLQREEKEAKMKRFFSSDPSENRKKETEEEIFHQKFLLFFITQWMPLERLKAHFKSVQEYGKSLYECVEETVRERYPDSYVFGVDEFVIAAVPCGKSEIPFSATAVSIGRKQLQEQLRKEKEEVQIYTISSRMTLEEGRKLYLHMLPFFHFMESFPENYQWDISAFAETGFRSVSQVFPYECLKNSIGHPEIFEEELEKYTELLWRAMDADGVFMLYHNLILQMEELGGHMILMPEKSFLHGRAEFLDFFRNKHGEIEQHLNKNGTKSYAKWLSGSIDYMKQNYGDSGLTVEQIAEQAGLSASRFSVLFRQETGQTVNDYLTEIRISQAIFLLENSSCKIYEIAELVGYKSSQYFGQVFQQKTGYKPLHFRKKKP